MFHNLSGIAKIVRMTPDGTNWELAAGQATSVSSVIDTNGYDAVMFVTALGTVSATGVITQTFLSSPDNIIAAVTMKVGTTAISLIGTAAMTKTAMTIDIYRPTQRYLTVQTITSVANSVIDGMFAILYRANYGETAVDPTVGIQAVYNHPNN